jgi:hypothetical protein
MLERVPGFLPAYFAQTLLSSKSGRLFDSLFPLSKHLIILSCRNHKALLGLSTGGFLGQKPVKGRVSHGKEFWYLSFFTGFVNLGVWVLLFTSPPSSWHGVKRGGTF